MSVRMQDVPVWGIDHHTPGGPVGHVILRAEHNDGAYLRWPATACGRLNSSMAVSKAIPNRICRKCRAALKDCDSAPVKEAAR